MPNLMTPKFKHDPAILERCRLALSRAGCNVDGPRSEAEREGQMIKDARDRVFLETQLEAALKTHQTQGYKHQGSILDALGNGIRELAAAISSHPASVDQSLLELLGQKPDVGDVKIINRSPLQWCATFNWHAEARMLMEAGAQPTLFKAGVSAVGLAAYSGSALCLAEMLAFGANARLELLPEHGIGDRSSIGSTLLHRLASRAVKSGPAMAQMLAESRIWYPDLHCKTADGRSIFDCAEGESNYANAFRQAILSVISAREREDLQNCASQDDATLRSRRSL